MFPLISANILTRQPLNRHPFCPSFLISTSPSPALPKHTTDSGAIVEFCLFYPQPVPLLQFYIYRFLRPYLTVLASCEALGVRLVGADGEGGLLRLREMGGGTRC